MQHFVHILVKIMGYDLLNHIPILMKHNYERCFVSFTISDTKVDS